MVKFYRTETKDGIKYITPGVECKSCGLHWEGDRIMKKQAKRKHAANLKDRLNRLKEYER